MGGQTIFHKERINSLLKEASELTAIFIKSRKTIQNNAKS